MLPRGVLGLHGQRRHAGVGHQVHARQPARGRVGGCRQAALGDERTDAEALMRRVLRVCHRSRPAEHRYRRVRALEPVGSMHVAAARVAYDLDGELRIDATAVRTPWRPGE